MIHNFRSRSTPPLRKMFNEQPTLKRSSLRPQVTFLPGPICSGGCATRDRPSRPGSSAIPENSAFASPIVVHGSVFFFSYTLEKKIALRQGQPNGGLTGDHRAVYANFISFRINLNIGGRT